MWVAALGGPLDMGVVLQGGQCRLGAIGLGATDQRGHFPWGSVSVGDSVHGHLH